MLIKDIMTKKIVTVSPEMGIRALAALFVKKNISGAPVVDKKGRLLGVVKEEGVIYQDKNVHLPTFISLSVGFLTLGADKYNKEVKKVAASKVSGIMEKGAPSIDPGMEIEDAATMMIEKGIYYFPVVDRGRLVGVVTKKDIVRSIAKAKA